MQLKKLFSAFLFLLLITALFSGCKKDDDNPVETGQAESPAPVTITSTGSGSISTTSGYKVTVIPGTVPANSTGASGSVAFSIETKVTPPKDLPASATRKSDFMKAGPDGFAFRWPVKVTVPFTNADASDIKLLYLDPLLDKWRIIPAGEIDNTAKKISADVMYLGYFCAATVTSSFQKAASEDSDGGFEFTADNSYYYTLTVASVSNWKYPSQASWYPNLVGASGSTGSYAGGGPLPTTHIHLAQATYQMWITRTKPGSLSTLPVIETYTAAASGTINQPVTYTSALSSGTGWTTLSMPGGGTWVEGSPANWPAPTITYGTGEFQATLTWINSSSKYSDVDLHLFGPGTTHVFYGAKTTTDGKLQLDRDWRYTTGTGVENIYSLAKVPAGEYKIKVNLWGGSTDMPFSVRIIQSGSVKTYTGTVTTLNSADDETKMITIATFTIQ